MQLMPAEYVPVPLTVAQQKVREKYVQLGFAIANRPFAGQGGLPWYHCTRMVDGVEGDFSVSLDSGDLYRWGTGEQWTQQSAAAAFAAGSADSPTAAVIPESVANIPAATPIASPSAEERYTVLGFEQLRRSAAVQGLQPKYFATRADGSRWLLDPNTEILTCMSDTPVSSWRVQRSAGSTALISVLTGAVRLTSSLTDEPRQPPSRQPVANPGPAKHTPAAEAAPKLTAARPAATRTPATRCRQAALFD